MKISVQLLSWNGEQYIPTLLESMRKQTHQDWELHILDNGSSDRTAELIQKEIKSFPVPTTFEQNDSNIGFAPGHNELFRRFGTDSARKLMIHGDFALIRMERFDP